MQEGIKRELDRALRSPRFAEIKTSSYGSSAGEFVRSAPIGDRTITLEEPRRENQGEETRIMVEDLDRGTLTIQAINGTVDLKPFVSPTAPGLIVATSNGVDNWSLTLFVGTGTDGPVGLVDGTTLRGNPLESEELEIPIPLGTHTMLMRGATTIVARALQTFFGDRLAYDEASNTVSAVDQIAALTASNGVVRELNNFREANISAQSLKVNSTNSVARPLPFPLGAHTFLANVGNGIVARTIQIFFGTGFTYDEPSGTLSADATTNPVTAGDGLQAAAPNEIRELDVPANSFRFRGDNGGLSGVRSDLVLFANEFAARFNNGLTFKSFFSFYSRGLSYDSATETAGLANSTANTMLGNQNGVTAQPVPIQLQNHALYFRGANNIAARGIASMLGSGLSYSNGAEQISANNQTDVLQGNRHVSREGNLFGLLDVIAHSFLARQAGTTGQMTNATISANQVAGRPGSGVIQGTQVLTDMIANLAVITGKIANQAVDFSKIINQNSNSIMGRFQGTNGTASSLSFQTNSFAAREGGTIFNKLLSSLAGANLSYNFGTGAIDAQAPGDPVPANNNATITRNSVGTLIASSMGTNSVIIRTTGSPQAFGFATNDVLRAVSGVLGVGLLVGNNLSNGIITALKMNLNDLFAWNGTHTFNGQTRKTANQNATIGTGTTVALGASTNTLRITISGGDTLFGMTGGTNGREVTIMNTSTSLFATLTPNASGANGFANLVDRTYQIPPGTSCRCQYDGTSQRWRPNCQS